MSHCLPYSVDVGETGKGLQSPAQDSLSGGGLFCDLPRSKRCSIISHGDCCWDHRNSSAAGIASRVRLADYAALLAAGEYCSTHCMMSIARVALSRLHEAGVARSPLQQCPALVCLYESPEYEMHARHTFPGS